ncbi:hypothetical protein EJ06DRAFT_580389 [Trichodelitschia bisporula]|uniref:POPLD-domain-containing protein n=1 Tax=Trichodelitschia bisporula TaxID=703511 RepID=A0A6G1I4N3_9PEZI|nr:hypothetical protein EJ06DRAFT_580389 [Trichodelitschia bisporula]
MSNTSKNAGSSQPSNKRKEGPAQNPRSQKRIKAMEMRNIAAQTTDKAFSNGELNIDKFVKAREFEIRALEDGLRNSRHGLSQRAFQEVPKDLRRRTASHNVKRVPKRLRKRAKREMIEDNTPTVTARRRTPSGQQRLRNETAKKLQKISSRLKLKQQKAKEAKAAQAKDDSKTTDTSATKATRENLMEVDDPATEHGPTSVSARKARVKTSTLKSPDQPPAKFRKRQLHKVWLPTHIFHAKRAHMPPPAQPLWKFAIPMTPTAKCYRPTHRAANERGVLAWDTSYMSTIGLEGPEKSIQTVLRAMGVGCNIDPNGLWSWNGRKWRQGTRICEVWLHEREACPNGAIAPATIIWNPIEPTEEPISTTSVSDVTMEDAGISRPKKPPKRKVIIRTHPAAFMQVWELVIRLAKVAKPTVTVEDLRFEIGSIEVAGPNALEAMAGVLHPVPNASGDSAVEDFFPRLAVLSPISTLPPNALMSFSISDPRLRHPPRTVPNLTPDAISSLLPLLATWPPDVRPHPNALFDRRTRQKATRLPSQKALNRRRAASLPGVFPAPIPTDPPIPLTLFVSRKPYPRITILLPWKCVSPVWTPLMFYPLSTGGTPRFAGLKQQQQLTFEANQPWFPGDFPTTPAGRAWEEVQRAEAKAKAGCQWKQTSDLYKYDWGAITGSSGVPTDAPNAQSKDAEGDIHMTDSPTRPQLTTVSLSMLAKGTPGPFARIYRLPTADSALRTEWLAQIPTPGRTANQTRRPLTLPLSVPRRERNAYLAAALLQEEEEPKRVPKLPGAEDLVGYVTTGEQHLGVGGGRGIGSVVLEKLEAIESGVAKGGKRGERKVDLGKLCIVCAVGGVGRLAKWEVVS